MELTHTEARERLSYLLDANYVRVDRVVTVSGDYGDDGRIEYRVSLQARQGWLDVPYIVGSGVPLHGYDGPDKWATTYPHPRSIDAVEARRRIRAAWTPEALDVVAAVLSDIGSADDCVDFAEWSIELGCELTTVEGIRGAEDAFRMIRTRYRPWSERVFGADLVEAIELAGAL